MPGVKLEEVDHDDAGPSSAARPDYKRYNTSDNTIISQFQKSLKTIVLSDNSRARANLEKVKVDINSDEFAKKVAKKLFYSLAHPHGAPHGEEDSKRMLIVHDFQPYFSSKEDAARAFALFDKDGNGDVTRREFRDTVVSFYRERKALSQSMRDTSQALGKIDIMLLLLSLLAVFFVTLAIFNVSIWNSLVPLGSLLLALTLCLVTRPKTRLKRPLFIGDTPVRCGRLCADRRPVLTGADLGLMAPRLSRAMADIRCMRPRRC